MVKRYGVPIFRVNTVIPSQKLSPAINSIKIRDVVKVELSKVDIVIRIVTSIEST